MNLPMYKGVVAACLMMVGLFVGCNSAEPAQIIEVEVTRIVTETKIEEVEVIKEVEVEVEVTRIVVETVVEEVIVEVEKEPVAEAMASVASHVK